MATDSLVIKDLHVSVEEKPILNGVNLTIRKGEVCALMGPNGSGKSTLAYTLMGHPKYQVLSGQVLFKGENLLNLNIEDRAKIGLFLSFQHPCEISVQVGTYLRTIYNNYHKSLDKKFEPLSVFKFQKLLSEKLKDLKIERKFVYRNLNENFSGGEKKRLEILQMAVIKPRFAILDETDSGLDIDAIKVIARGVEQISQETGMGTIIITHYQRILMIVPMPVS